MIYQTFTLRSDLTSSLIAAECQICWCPCDNLIIVSFCEFTSVRSSNYKKRINLPLSKVNIGIIKLFRRRGHASGSDIKTNSIHTGLLSDIIFHKRTNNYRDLTAWYFIGSYIYLHNLLISMLSDRTNINKVLAITYNWP